MDKKTINRYAKLKNKVKIKKKTSIKQNGIVNINIYYLFSLLWYILII